MAQPNWKKERVKGRADPEGWYGEGGGRGFRMGNTCTPMADSCWCMAKPIQYCKVIKINTFKLNNNNNNKRKSWKPSLGKEGQMAQGEPDGGIWTPLRFTPSPSCSSLSLVLGISLPLVWYIKLGSLHLQLLALLLLREKKNPQEIIWLDQTWTISIRSGPIRGRGPWLSDWTSLS